MSCRRVREYLDGLLTADNGLAIEQDVKEHLEHCPQCQREHAAALTTLVLLKPSIKIDTTADLKERIMKALVERENSQSECMAVPRNRRNLWQRSLAAGMAAALVLLALAFAMLKPSSPVYALEQTIKAYEGLKFIHLRMTPQQFGSVSEVWAELDGEGKVVRLRTNFADTEDGPKDVVFENGKAQVWFKKKGAVRTCKEGKVSEQFRDSYKAWDPKLCVEDLLKRHEDGDADVSVEKSASGAPISITVSGKRDSGRKEVLTVDPETRLLQKREVFRNGSLVETTEFQDYNKAPDPAVFTLDAPPDAVRIDETTGNVGIAQEGLSDTEVAVKAVREFFEALIAKDYGRAGSICGGLPAEKTREYFERLNAVRIVSIGEPVPHKETKALRVPCKIEILHDGKKEVWEPVGPLVRQLHEQPGRWQIIGGI